MNEDQIKKNKDPEVPIGFGLALSNNFSAISHFSSLPVKERNRVIEKSSEIHSDTDMQKYVDSHFGKNTTS